MTTFNYDMTINQRITDLINTLYLGNKRAFSIAINVSPAVIENIVGKRQSAPSYEITSKIISSIDNINIEWLMTGKGNMIKTNKPYSETNQTQTTFAESQTPYGQQSNVNLSELENSSKDELISVIKQLLEVNNRNSISIEKMVETADRNSITLSRLVDILYGDNLKGGNHEIDSNAG